MNETGKVVLGIADIDGNWVRITWNPEKGPKGFDIEAVEGAVNPVWDAFVERLVEELRICNAFFARQRAVGKEVRVWYGKHTGKTGVILAKEGEFVTIDCGGGDVVRVRAFMCDVVNPEKYMLPEEKLWKVAERAADTLDWGLLYRKGAITELFKVAESV